MLYESKYQEALDYFVIQQLIKLGADLSARDDVSQNSHTSLVLYLNFCRMNKMLCMWLHRDSVLQREFLVRIQLNRA